MTKRMNIQMVKPLKIKHFAPLNNVTKTSKKKHLIQ